MSEEPILAWHFVNGTLRDGRPIPPDGEWLHHKGKCAMCRHGLHASLRIVDALRYAPGSTICRVAMANIAEEGEDKIVARSRFIMWRLENQDELLRKFARQVALSVIHLWDAPDVVRQYLETGNESIRYAARGAAWDAAWDAVWDAAWGAAWDAARGAAWGAAWDAAWGAAMKQFNVQLEALVLEARGYPDDEALLRKVPHA